MKNLPILVAATFCMMMFSSCLKNYNCKCKIKEPAVMDNNGTEVVPAIETTSTSEYRKRSKNGAAKECKTDEKEYKAILDAGTTVMCYLE